MSNLYNRPICVASGLLLPFLFFANPPWLTLMGVGPCWAVLWLLPWALVDGPKSAAIAGMLLGCLLDGMTLGDATYIPSLLCLGLWWGNLGVRREPFERRLNLGLLAWLGSCWVGITLWLQFVLRNHEEPSQWLGSWGFSTVLAQSLLTGLIAPIFCSFILLFFRKQKALILEKNRFGR